MCRFLIIALTFSIALVAAGLGVVPDANAAWRGTRDSTRMSVTPAGDGRASTGIVDGDCDDSNGNVFPGQLELIGNRLDDDCDRLADEDANDEPSTDDNDFDGDGRSLLSLDCDDTALSVHPGANEIPDNARDDDCDGLADEDAQGNPSANVDDLDGDGVTIGSDRIFAGGFESPPVG